MIRPLLKASIRRTLCYATWAGVALIAWTGISHSVYARPNKHKGPAGGCPSLTGFGCPPTTDRARSIGPIGGAVRSLAVDPSTPSTVYAGTEQGVMKSTDAGTTWRAANKGISKTVVTGFVIDHANPATVYVATWDGVFKSFDAGANWNRCGLPGFTMLSIAADPYNSRVLYAAGSRVEPYASHVFRTTDGGKTWTPIDEGLPRGGAVRLAVAPTNPPTLYLGLDGYGVFKRTRKAWTRTANTGRTYSNGTTVLSLVVDPQNPSTVYAAFFFDGVFKSTDAGRTWAHLNNGLELHDTLSIHSLAIDPTRPSTLYAGTRSGVFKSTDGAMTWVATSLKKPGDPPYLFLPIAIDPNNSDTVYAGPGRGYGGGKDLQGSVFKTTDAGATWVRQASFVANVVSAIAIDPWRPAVLYAGTQGGVFVSNDGGANWLSSGLGDVDVDALVIDPATPGTMYAGSRGRGVFKTTDFGATWREAQEGLTEPEVLCLAIDPSHPAGVYAGTTGGIFKSTNGGDHWSLARASPAVHGLQIVPQNPTILYAALADGVLKSTDDGSNWSNGDLKGAAMALTVGTQSTVYAGTCHGVFKSTDGGTTWKVANAGIVRALVYALVVDPDVPNTVYAGTLGMYDHGGVLKSTDAGITWKRIADGRVSALALGATSPRTLYAATLGNGVIAVQEVERRTAGGQFGRSGTGRQSQTAPSNSTAPPDGGHGAVRSNEQSEGSPAVGER
jgi:photosystem II stability/assembly factor-like uncharacterized protein